MDLIPVGDRAALVAVPGTAAAHALVDRARRTGLVADDIVPGASTVLFDGVRIEDVAALLDDPAHLVAADPGDLVVIPVDYDGPDLRAVADAWHCSVAEVIARHTACEFTSAFCGFSPGFAYLSGLDPASPVPRLATPRPRVPAGSVAVAGTWCAVYPGASPGGWLLLGTTDMPLWDVEREPPALLPPGTRVRFTSR